MNTNSKVVRATLIDIEVLVDLFDCYRQFYGKGSDREGARQFLTERLSHRESEIYFVPGEKSGHGFVQLYPSFSSVSMRRIWILNDLYVAEDARRMGVAGALLDAAVEFARSDNACRLVLATGYDNHAAQSLYMNRGWTRDEDFWHFNFELG